MMNFNQRHQQPSNHPQYHQQYHHHHPHHQQRYPPIQPSSFNLSSHQTSHPPEQSDRPADSGRKIILKRPILPPLIMSTTKFPNSSHQPRVAPYSASDRSSFAYQSVVKRWPTILTQVIDHLVTLNNSLLDQISSISKNQPQPLSLSSPPSSPSSSTPHNQELKSLKLKLSQAKTIITQISEIKYEAARDKPLKPLDFHPGNSDQERQSIDLYNQELLKSKAASKPTWFSASWLLTECYLYQQLHNFFNRTEHWKGFDPFEHQKRSSFKSSWDAVLMLCLSLDRLTSESKTMIPDNQLLKIQFKELLVTCLWGNATDLSLLPNISHDEIKLLQTSASRNPDSIIRDDSDLVWQTCVSSLNDHLDDPQIGPKRIDFVLDNAGFELFTDLVLADWIVTNSRTQIMFHPKLIPWFVSDVIRKDIDQLIESMIEPAKFFELAINPDPSKDSANSSFVEGHHDLPRLVDDQHLQIVRRIGLRWKAYFSSGIWKIIDPTLLSFWTNPLPFWDIPSRDPDLFNQLKSSDLVIFKGDLNYRKLTGDAKWETTTSFEEAIGPLNGLFNILSLRTCKADVCVGLEPDKETYLNLLDPDWRINGKFGLISFVPKNK